MCLTLSKYYSILSTTKYCSTLVVKWREEKAELWKSLTVKGKVKGKQAFVEREGDGVSANLSLSLNDRIQEVENKKLWA